MKNAFLVLALLFVIPASNQQHAPTAEQCLADARIWSHQAPDHAAALPYQELNAREAEMQNCHIEVFNIDYMTKENATLDFAYTSFSRKYLNEQRSRLVDFLARHKLDDEFSKEDSEGKR